MYNIYCRHSHTVPSPGCAPGLGWTLLWPDCISPPLQGFDWDGLETRSLTPPILPKVQSTADTSNFDKYPRDEAVPADESSGWDKDF